MARIDIAVIGGDGIGPEVTAEAVKALECAARLGGFGLCCRHLPAGQDALRTHGSALPDSTVRACLDSQAVLLGAFTGRSLLTLREQLGGFASLRPARFYQALAENSPLKEERAAGADILVVRELLGGLYYGEPRAIDRHAGCAFNTMRYSREEIRRVAVQAFELARVRRQKMVSADKANALETSQLWRETVDAVSASYPDVAVQHLYVDACAMLLVSRPREFDVILAGNLFGDILSDEAMVLTGSLGMLPSATIGGKVGLFEPVHGTAPDIAGKEIANPLGAIASAALLLRYAAGRESEARAIERAIERALDDGFRTPDLGGGARMATTQEMGDAVCKRIG